MMKTAQEMVDNFENIELETVDLSQPLQKLFDECMNFISTTSFDI